MIIDLIWFEEKYQFIIDLVWLDLILTRKKVKTNQTVIFYIQNSKAEMVKDEKNTQVYKIHYVFLRNLITS